MTAFYVGQSVRVNCPDSYDHGKETTVRRLGVEVAPDYEGGPYTGIEVDIECDCQDDGVWGCVFEPHELIPLSPPKSQIQEILAMKDLPNRDCKIARVGECV